MAENPLCCRSEDRFNLENSSHADESSRLNPSVINSNTTSREDRGPPPTISGRGDHRRSPDRQDHLGARDRPAILFEDMSVFVVNSSHISGSFIAVQECMPRWRLRVGYRCMPEAGVDAGEARGRSDLNRGDPFE